MSAYDRKRKLANLKSDSFQDTGAGCAISGGWLPKKKGITSFFAALDADASRTGRYSAGKEGTGHRHIVTRVVCWAAGR
jgi:hypothetical protein